VLPLSSFALTPVSLCTLQDLPDLSAIFVDRLLSAGVFSGVALTRTLAACGCPAALDRLSPAELAETIRRAAKVKGSNCLCRCGTALPPFCTFLRHEEEAKWGEEACLERRWGRCFLSGPKYRNRDVRASFG
jgi:hypothetical protein